MPGRIATRAVDAAAPLASAASQGNAQQILDGWRESAFHVAVTQLARASLKPEYQKAFQAQSQRFGRELTDEEMEMIADSVDDRLLKGARQQLQTQLSSDPTAKARLVADAAAELQARAPTLRNPFAPIAAGDPAARAKEKVLWENGTLMVLVDRFSKTPHLLVVPKAPMLLPTDAPPATLDELGRVGKVASDVFSKVARVGASETFVNPPQFVSIGQLHLHVSPPMKALTDKGTAKLWAKVGAALTKALGS
jgi:diadenosine tetraphosphate (Ap4A) HIT family hydrolase